MPTPRKRPPIGSGVETAEVKVTIRPDQEVLAERALGISADSAEERRVYFYDTPQLKLFDAGLILRARLIRGDDDDSTVKVRPVRVEDLDGDWREEQGFKLEADYVGNREVISASLTVTQKRDEIEAVATGRRPIDKSFSKDQERFLAHFYQDKVDFGELSVLGPIHVLRWKLKPEGFGYDVTVEEWRLAEGDDLIEVSFKTAPRKVAEAQLDFEEFLRSHDLDPEGEQQAKTRTALEYFARRSKP